MKKKMSSKENSEVNNQKIIYWDDKGKKNHNVHE